jgi:hypothetical protein
MYFTELEFVMSHPLGHAEANLGIIWRSKEYKILIYFYLFKEKHIYGINTYMLKTQSEQCWYMAVADTTHLRTIEKEVANAD